MNAWVVTILLICGLVFFVGGTVGIIRFPDFYTRLHAAGKLDTMGLLLTMVAAVFHLLHDFTVANIFTGLKILLIVAFVYITSPTATHAIADAGIRSGLAPWTKKDTKDRL
ncbi:MAG: monovalent cation/H(+) antiporter subunit G [Deltaproteobacteria bacterium]|nr:monovalent cation/H(+) antiporter subunit G [Deltaproteobacteria bacterium]